MLPGAGGFALKVAFKGWMFCPGLCWDVLLLWCILCCPPLPVPGVRGDLWHPAHTGTIPTCVIPVKDPFLLSQENVELNRWIVTQHTAAKAPLLSLQNVTQTVEEEKPEPPTIQEIKQKIEKYNAKVTNCLLMKLVRPGLVSPHTHTLLVVSVGSEWGQPVGKVSLG